MKKAPLAISAITAIIVIFTAAKAFAGDLPEAIITLWDTDVFIGTITEIKDGAITINVSEALFDNYDVNEITLDKFEYMSMDDSSKTPETGDNLAVAVEFKDGAWRVVFSDDALGYAGLAAKSDGLQPETLKLHAGGNAFIERMNGYINDGTYSYENRKEIFDRINNSEKKEPDKDTSVKAAPLVTEQRKIAEETKIVTPPPQAQSTAKSYQKPERSAMWYLAVLLISAAVGFISAKRWTNR